MRLIIWHFLPKRPANTVFNVWNIVCYWLEQEKQPKIEDTFGLLQELFELMKV